MPVHHSQLMDFRSWCHNECSLLLSSRCTVDKVFYDFDWEKLHDRCKRKEYGYLCHAVWHGVVDFIAWWLRTKWECSIPHCRCSDLEDFLCWVPFEHGQDLVWFQMLLHWLFLLWSCLRTMHFPRLSSFIDSLSCLFGHFNRFQKLEMLCFWSNSSELNMLYFWGNSSELKRLCPWGNSSGLSSCSAWPVVVPGCAQRSFVVQWYALIRCHVYSVVRANSKNLKLYLKFFLTLKLGPQSSSVAIVQCFCCACVVRYFFVLPLKSFCGAYANFTLRSAKTNFRLR